MSMCLLVALGTSVAIRLTDFGQLAGELLAVGLATALPGSRDEPIGLDLVKIRCMFYVLDLDGDIRCRVCLERAN